MYCSYFMILSRSFQMIHKSALCIIVLWNRKFLFTKDKLCRGWYEVEDGYFLSSEVKLKYLAIIVTHIGRIKQCL